MIAEQKERTLNAHYAAHPERFIKGCPTVAMPPSSVSINPVQPGKGDADTSSAINFPTLPSAKYTANKFTLTV